MGLAPDPGPRRWWAAGLVLGLSIFALFALFEKKRERVLQLVEGLRHWEG